MSGKYAKGQTLVEYTAVCALLVLALLWGQPDVIDQLIAAWHLRFDQFAAGMAQP